MDFRRVFDGALALVLLVLLAPLMAVIALAIVIDDGLPVIFKQTRVGKDGVLFEIYKFRTMRKDAEKLGPKVTSRNDPRITRIGRWLRKWKLDELPQLWNVLKGDMAFVGPRPEVPEYVRYYPEDAKRVIFSVRPGITDPASLAFVDEEVVLARAKDAGQAYIEEVLPKKIEMSKRYLEGRTLLSDLAMIMKTSIGILKGRKNG